MLARVLIQLENEGARYERQRLLDIGLNKTPQLDRAGIVSLVQVAWLSINHAQIAETGYKQTGPSMPLTGPVHPKDVFRDLLRVLEELDQSPDPNVVAMSLRDEAVAFVLEGWNSGKWIHWSDCHKLLEEQDGVGEALEEGLEAFDEVAVDYDDDPVIEDVDEDGGDVGGPVGLSAKTGPGGVDLGHEPDESDGDDSWSSVDGATVSGGHAIASSDPSPLAAASEAGVVTVAVARQVLYHDAKRTGDDVMLRHVRSRMQTEDQKTKDQATRIGVLLVERGRVARDAERQANLDRLADDRLAAKDLEALKRQRAEAEKATAEARLAHLQQVVVNRRDAQARKERDVVDRCFRRWLQTQYPAMLARRCILVLRNLRLTPGALRNFDASILSHYQDKTFRRQLFIKDIWIADSTFTRAWSQAKGPFGGVPRVVRCSTCFQEIVNDVAPQSHAGHAPVETLCKLFKACVPRARKIFDGSYTPLRLLELNDYVLEKAFVYGIICLSKWLAPDEFPQGVFGNWPPPIPDGLVAEWAALASSPSAHDAQLPAHMHVGGPSASSGSGAPLPH